MVDTPSVPSGGRCQPWLRLASTVQFDTISRAVAKAQATDGATVAAAMREIPVEDMMTNGARIRDDGWVMRDLYLFR